MAFFSRKKKRKAYKLHRKLDQQLTETIKEVYHKYQLLQELEQSAYEVPEELYMLRKVEGAKYLYLMKEARRRNLSADVAAPRKARTFWLQKRGYQKDRLFNDKE